MEFTTKGALDIKGCFFVLDYQRGYRWGEGEVKQLLDDIYENGEKNYYLQPIVVKRKGGNYELIDGRQRLTTIYLILSCIKEILPKTPINYQITYETRQETYDFLREIDLGRKNENIDFFRTLFDKDLLLVSKALLTYGDYSQTYNDKRYRLIASHNYRTWQEMLHPSQHRKEFEKTKDIIAQLLAELNGDISIENLKNCIQSFLNNESTPKDWRYYFIKYGSILWYAENGLYYQEEQ